MSPEERFDIRLESKEFSCADLRVLRLDGREAINELFRFDVEVVAVQGKSLPEKAAPGARVRLELTRGEQHIRTIYGMLQRVRARRDPHIEHKVFALRIVPRAATLELVKKQQILQSKTAVEIFKEQLALISLGKRDVLERNTSSYPKSEFVVQYQETDWAFVSRLAEHVGVNYFFEHSRDDDADSEAGAGREQLVLTDQKDGFHKLAGLERLEWSESDNTEERLLSLDEDQHMVPSAYVVHDYNYRRPDIPLSATVAAKGHGGGHIECGVHVKKKDEAELLAKVRSEEALCRARSFAGASSISQLSAGRRVKVTTGQAEATDTELLIVAVEHHAEIPPFWQADKEPSYNNRFEAVSTEHTFRPLRRTPRPVIAGLVTGIVQGKEDSETHLAKLDDEGRYTVQFHFDMLGKDKQTSRPCRMAQPFGGPEADGMHFPLRPGTEVILAFVNGDPDRPIIVGAVPNRLAPSPVTEQNARQSRIKTSTGVLIEISERK